MPGLFVLVRWWFATVLQRLLGRLWLREVYRFPEINDGCFIYSPDQSE